MNFTNRSSSNLKGPRPIGLTISRNSMKMKKSQNSTSTSGPVIIYVRSPKIIHVQPQEFMKLVQQLTGNTSSSLSSNCSSYYGAILDYVADNKKHQEKTINGDVHQKKLITNNNNYVVDDHKQAAFELISSTRSSNFVSCPNSLW